MRIRKAYIAALHDIAMAAISFVASLYLRLGDNFAYAEPSLIPGIIIFTLTCALVFLSIRLYQGVWRYASMHDLIKLTKAVTISIIVFLPIMFLYNRLEGIPRSVFVINWFVLLALLGGPRFVFRMVKRKQLLPRLGSVEGRKKITVLLVGVNDHTEMFLRDVMGSRNSEYEVVGILDNDQDKIGRYIYNVKIYGHENSIVRVVEKLRNKGKAPQKILFSPGYIDKDAVKQLLEKSDALGLTLARIPRLTELKANIEDKLELQPIAVEDLLGRPQAALDRNKIKNFIKDKRVLVTGAGGTIGSEIVRQVALYQPAHITLLENSEHSLYQIDKELEENFPAIARSANIGDVRDLDRLNITFAQQKPAIVFHAAALKHVPLSEANVDEAALTNVIGTKNVADACVEAKVKQMIMISTDKAVNPTSVMGATKRIAEYYVQAMGQDKKKSKNTSFITVRFGNVLGSAGSVVPLFKRQLEAGGPITVTDPKITRYFMTVREAVELVLQSSVLGDGEKSKSAIYVLDMGEPVLIKDLAHQMIRLAGLVPEKDIEVKYTGLRPGEKMYEELFYEEEAPEKTRHESIMLAKPRPASLKELNKLLEKLVRYARERETKDTLQTLKKLCPEFK